MLSATRENVYSKENLLFVSEVEKFKKKNGNIQRKKIKSGWDLYKIPQSKRTFRDKTGLHLLQNAIFKFKTYCNYFKKYNR